VTVIATPNAGYNFVNWTENGTPVSSSINYTFAANGSRNLVANFAAVACTYSLSASASGTLACAGVGGSVTITASDASCPWTATTSDSWIHTSSAGLGTGIASYTVDSNGSPNSRSGSITIGGT